MKLLDQLRVARANLQAQKDENEGLWKYIEKLRLDLKAKDAALSSPCIDGLDGIAVKMKKYFCRDYNCSDSHDNQYPECEARSCAWRDRNVDDLIDIIKDAV